MQMYEGNAECKKWAQPNNRHIQHFGSNLLHFQWVGPISDINAEFDLINKDGGDEILFTEFIDWALEKDLDIEDDDDNC